MKVVVVPHCGTVGVSEPGLCWKLPGILQHKQQGQEESVG